MSVKYRYTGFLVTKREPAAMRLQKQKKTRVSYETKRIEYHIWNTTNTKIAGREQCHVRYCALPVYRFQGGESAKSEATRYVETVMYGRKSELSCWFNWIIAVGMPLAKR